MDLQTLDTLNNLTKLGAGTLSLFTTIMLLHYTCKEANKVENPANPTETRVKSGKTLQRLLGWNCALLITLGIEGLAEGKTTSPILMGTLVITLNFFMDFNKKRVRKLETR